MKPIYEIKDLVIDYELKRFTIRAINNTSLNIQKGAITALVGESGSGKTTLASSLLQVISYPGRIVSGSVIYHNEDKPKLYDYYENEKGEVLTNIEKLSTNQLNKYRWKECSMVFQGAQSSLNPVMTIFEQFYETMQVHQEKRISYKEFKQKVLTRAKEVLNIVNLDEERILPMYPHELSGGMKQRVMIAFSLLLKPKFIILDEPTTALDVITQDYIFRILKDINKKQDITMLLLTHDIGVVAKFADFVGVMYAGQLVEYGTTLDVFAHKYHPYTEGLINATPSIIADNSTLRPIEGNPPDLMDLPSGCPFHPRCKKAMDVCKKVSPPNINKNNLQVRCHLYSEGSDE